jgi:hypothetical protein
MGRAERIEILTRNGLSIVSDWLRQRRGTGIGRDDLIDACARGLAARDSKDTIPVSDVPTSPRDLSLIWY